MTAGNFKRWISTLGILVMAVPATATAQATARSYAVVSEIAREVQAVVYQESIGTRINRNQRETLAVPTSTMDKLALVAAEKTLRVASPGAKVWLLAPADTDFFEGGLETAAGRSVKLPADLDAALQENKITHLLLFTRHRAQAEFRFREYIDGEGNLEGIGFFIERRTRVTNVETSQTGLGFLAPYVYFRATLIDVAARKVLRTETVRATRVHSAGEAKDGITPWQALTPTEKMTTLREMLEGEIQRVVPLLAAAP